MQIITKQYLQDNPNYVFVFGDNALRTGYGGAAQLRDQPNTYGFITKKYPSNRNSAFYRPEEYSLIFEFELELLCDEIEKFTDNIYLISKLGSGLANKYLIYEKVIESGIKALNKYSNIKFLYNWSK